MPARGVTGRKDRSDNLDSKPYTEDAGTGCAPAVTLVRRVLEALAGARNGLGAF